MVKISEAFQGSYFKASELARPALLSFKSVDYEKVGSENPETKLVARFKEDERGLVLNSTNAGIISGLYGDDCDAWVGKPIVLFCDDTVRNPRTGEMGGVRVRKPKAKSTKTFAEEAKEIMEDDDQQAPF